MQTKLSAAKEAADDQEANSKATALSSSDAKVVPRFEEFGPDYIDWMHTLFKALGEDIQHIQYSGLVKAVHKASGAMAWVCRGDQSTLTGSNCCHRFLTDGEACLMIKINYE